MCFTPVLNGTELASGSIRIHRQDILVAARGRGRPRHTRATGGWLEMKIDIVG